MDQDVAIALAITAIIWIAWALTKPRPKIHGYVFELPHIAVLTVLRIKGPMTAIEIARDATKGREADFDEILRDLGVIMPYCAEAGVVEEVDGKWSLTPQGAAACQIALPAMASARAGGGDGEGVL